MRPAKVVQQTSEVRDEMTNLPDPYLGFFKFNVRDQDKVEQFYKTAFGFIRVDHIDLPMFEERVLRLPNGTVSLVLYSDKNGGEIDVGTAHGPVGIMTHDVDTMHKAALAAGATEKLAPMDFGPARLSFVYDPEGHEVEIIKMPVQTDEKLNTALGARWAERIESGKAYAEQDLWADYLALEPIKPAEIMGTWRGGKFDGGTTPDPINWYGKRFNSMENVEPLLITNPDGSIGVFDKLGPARLREVEFKGKVSSTIIYNNMPIMDYFRKIDDDTIIGWGEVAGDTPDFFFWLKRDGS